MQHLLTGTFQEQLFHINEDRNLVVPTKTSIDLAGSVENCIVVRCVQLCSLYVSGWDLCDASFSAMTAITVYDQKKY